MSTWRWILVAAVLGACGSDGSTGPEGPAGADGADGMMGSQGEPGPVAEPPVIAELSPRWGSGTTQVTIRGANFATTLADNNVYFGGVPATVLSGTASELVVRADFDVAAPDTVIVNVETGNQFSNGIAFELVPAGTARYHDAPLPTAPTSVVAVGADIYIAAGVDGASRTGGLFKLTNGVVSQVVRADLVTVGNNQIIDGPLALATFGGNVYFTTTFGAVRKYTVATGVVTDVAVLPALGAGNVFPARTGLAFDAAGTLYVVDRNAPGVIRISPTNVVTGFAAPAGIYGITSDGTDLFLSNDTANSVTRVTNPTGVTPTLTVLDTDIFGLHGITTVGANVIVATEFGELFSIPKTGGTLAAFGDTAGYVDDITGLATMGTDVLMAQPAGSVVRRKPAASPDATIISAGLRIAFGTVELGGKWYVSTLGASAVGGISIDQPDGAIIEIDPAGTSRVLATTFSPLGLAVSGATQLTVADCLEARIFTLDTGTAAQTNRLTATELVGDCPAAVVVDSAGTLFYIDGGSIGRLVGTTLTAAHGTGVVGDSLALAGGQLVVSTRFDDEDPQTPAVGILKVSAANGGAATSLVPPSQFFYGPVASAPDGALFALRQFTGDLVAIDPATGAVSTVGSASPPERPFGPTLAASFALSPDHTAHLMDLFQGQLVSVAP